MEERRNFKTFILEKEHRERQQTKMNLLQQESDYYQYRIKRDLQQFIGESSVKHDCSMKAKYVQLLQKTLTK